MEINLQWCNQRSGMSEQLDYNGIIEKMDPSNL